MEKLINYDSVSNYLNENKLQFLIEYKIIKYKVPDYEFEVYVNDESFLLIQNMPYGIYASIINFTYDSYFLFLNYLKTKYNNFSLSITIHPQTDVNKDLLDNTTIYKTFVGKQMVLTSDVHSDYIKVASTDDHSIIKSFEEEKLMNTITLNEAFDDYIRNNTGEIYLYLKKDELVGYLVCSSEIENIWDVVYIYVKPEHRNNGIGTRLAVNYLNSKISANQIPLYSGVSSSASEKAALKSGFELCSTIIYQRYN